MCFKIEHRPVRFPSRCVLTEEIKSLLTGLLEKEPSNRLACGGRGVTSILRHDFYLGLDWELLEQRRLRPPEIILQSRPKIVGREGLPLQNFEETKTRGKVAISPQDNESKLHAEFSAFSFGEMNLRQR